MPYCEKCKSEYDEGFKTCADCGTLLNEGSYTEEVALEEQPAERLMQKTLLKSSVGSTQAQIIRDVLEQNGIKALVRSDEVGEYFKVTGRYSFVSEDIFVDIADYERAKEILEALPLDGEAVQDVPDEDAKFYGRAERSTTGKKIAIRAVAIVSAGVFVFMIVYWAVELIKNI